ncbi:PH domain-containing protein [Rhodopirellula sp. JC740]|uniref:PH domain-containing protein n=1 Tax=Rhodopirellula halodulae TaxID=2894198 RepID=A0ABS8NM75_9BACT|nr:PH domain-containing protein [Rhodopirellula sp. JC740]MCC9644678.1 PH domain-containing protein [Rhodopirellula sp. JC740]
MKNASPIVFPSAVDRWLVFVLLAPIFLAVGIAAYLLNEGRADEAGTMVLMAAAIAAVTAVFTIPCRYTLLADTLSIRCGLLCYQVDYADITEAVPSSTLVSGPALSLRRVIVRTSKREFIVSPDDRERFIEELMRRVAATKETDLTEQATTETT